MRAILERLRRVQSSGIMEGLNVKGNVMGGVCGCVIV
jgi:hypothetical protein